MRKYVSRNLVRRAESYSGCGTPFALTCVLEMVCEGLKTLFRQGQSCYGIRELLANARKNGGTGDTAETCHHRGVFQGM